MTKNLVAGVSIEQMITFVTSLKERLFENEYIDSEEILPLLNSQLSAETIEQFTELNR